jgi:hypothetical protein
MNAVESFKAAIKPAYQKVMDILPPRWHVIAEYFRVYRRLPNLDNPRTFSEKIMWRKLYDRDPRLPPLVDKIRVKEIMAARFGADFVIPTLAVFDTADALDFSKAPLDKPPYVLKANHGSSMNIIVKSRADIDPPALKKKLAKYLKFDHAAVAEEWAYAPVPRKIFAETFIEMPGGDLPDYKFHVFSGRVYAIEAIVDRFRNYGVGFYSRDWKRLDMAYAGNRYPPYKGELKPPKHLAGMIARAEDIGRDFSYVRVDLYEIGGQIKLGELTFYPSAGHDPFEPIEWDARFGDQWRLNTQAPQAKLNAQSFHAV